MSINVEVCSFQQLIDSGLPLALDNYQRPYVWNQDKVEQLVADMIDFQRLSQIPDYYMGTLLLHKRRVQNGRRKRFVIDGQQRLTSLAVLYYILHEELPERIEFHYRSKLSVINIQQAKKIFSTQAKEQIKTSIFGRLCFTVITVKREDLAFTFFDTQNNRGVPLEPTDLLKAFHLRAINSQNLKLDEQLQRYCASRWENLQKPNQEVGNKKYDFAPVLFHYYLWRARNWRGQRVVERETHDDILRTFQQQSVSHSDTECVTTIPLYPNRHNLLATTLRLQADDSFQLDLKSLKLDANPAELPFSIRQPIHQGVGFFLYAQKYAALLNILLHDETIDLEIKAVRQLREDVMLKTSHYLRELFDLAVLMYVDKFGSQGLLKFALWLEHVLGIIRLEKAYIFKQAPLKFLKEAELNLLDVIAGSYRPEEVLQFLQAEAKKKADSLDNLFAHKKIESGKGVQGIYLQAILTFYGKKSLESSTDKTSCISEEFIQEKINMEICNVI